jgi:hypothetical protein
VTLRPAALLALAACAARARPQETVEAYRRALSADDPAAAWALLSAEQRGSRTKEDFARTWRQLAEERGEQERALRRPSAPELSASTTVLAADLELAREAGFWRVRRAPVPGQPPRTPEEAVRALLRAAEHNNLDAFLRLLSSPVAEKLRKKIGERVARLRAALDRPIPVEGDRATLQYDARFRIELRREGDEWRIEDFD